MSLSVILTQLRGLRKIITGSVRRTPAESGRRSIIMKDRHIPDKVRLAVLTEAGFRCAVPTCKTIIALDLHHIVSVSDSGPNDAINLLALCPTCHALHHRGTIPLESIRVWKENLVNSYLKSSSKCPSSNNPLQSGLRVLYFHDQPRSSGLGYIRSRQLVKELEKRGHILRFCWAVHTPLINDTISVSKDILNPQIIREWQPQALVFESGLFVGEPRIPLDLLYDLEANGAVAIIAIPPYEYEDSISQYDSFFDSRSISIPSANNEPPRCKGDIRGGDIVFSSIQLERYSVVGNAILNNVSSIRLGSARPMTGSQVLIVGQENVFVKAYNNRDIHGITYPVLGILNDKDYRTEAIFLADIASDFKMPCDNHVYLANLLEWLSRLRIQSYEWSADSAV